MKRYNQVFDRLSDPENKLLHHHISELRRKLRPGLFRLNWSSLGADVMLLFNLIITSATNDGQRTEVTFSPLSVCLLIKITYRLLSLWRPHKNAAILHLKRFKVRKNSLLIPFVGEMEMEITVD